MTSSPAPSLPCSSSADAAIARLQSRKTAWMNTTIAERIDYLTQCLNGVIEISHDWTNAACRAKGIDPNSSLAGEEWLAGVVTTLMNLRSLINTLQANGQRPLPSVTIAGQTRAKVFPQTLMDRLLWLGFEGEIWLEPGKPSTQGKIYREPTSGKVALVLGAGNIASTPPMDSLYKLFGENQVVLLKMNPVNDYLGQFLEKAFAPLIRDGFLQILCGGADLGRYLCQHPGIETVHITGSDRTHDAIVWGTSEPRTEPILQKPITSELGCVTPVLVVPGNWSTSDLAYQARHVASMVVHNASFNCVAAKAIVLAKGWHQREEFLRLLHQEFVKIAPRNAYYPGAQERYQAFLDRYPNAQAFSDRTSEIIPWTVISDVPPTDHEYALNTEAFCGVIAEVNLETTTTTEFLTQAVTFVNQKVWGNLSCVVLIDPKTRKQYQKEFDAAIAALNYGAIGVNVWTGVVYAIPDLSWGAFPGNPLSEIRSGRGVVHNAALFDFPQKSVLSAPFRIRPIPFWFANHRNLLSFAKRAAELQVSPTWINFLKVVMAALKG